MPETIVDSLITFYVGDVMFHVVPCNSVEGEPRWMVKKDGTDQFWSSDQPIDAEFLATFLKEAMKPSAYTIPKIEVVRQKSDGRHATNSLDVCEVRYNGVSLLDGLKGVGIEIAKNDCDQVTLTFVGNIELRTQE